MQRPRRVSLRPVEELPDEASLERLEDRAAGAPLDWGIDVLLDPFDEVFRSEADEVRLLRTLDHPFLPPVRAAGRPRTTRISVALLTLRPRRVMIEPPPAFWRPPRRRSTG